MKGAAKKAPVRTLITRMLAGAIVGAASMGLFLAFVGDPFVNLDDPANVIAIVAGLSYVVIGLGVAFGLAAPKAGATYLNVEDADEIREQGAALTPSAIACVLVGAFLLVLVLAETIGSGVALPIASACLVGIGIAGWFTARNQDELTKQIGLEASSIAYQIVLAGLGVWALLAAVGIPVTVSPLGLVAGLSLLQLFTAFAVITKRGMLMPR